MLNVVEKNKKSIIVLNQGRHQNDGGLTWWCRYHLGVGIVGDGDDGNGGFGDDFDDDYDLVPPPRLVGNGSIRMKKPIQATPLPPRKYLTAQIVQCTIAH